MEYIDLHVHSNSSDGSDSPGEIVKIAAASGLAAVALFPVMPGISEKIQTLLGCAPAEKFEGHQTWGRSLVGKTFGAGAILFPRPDPKKNA